MLDGNPRALGCLIAHGPVGRKAVVAARVHKLETASAAVGPLSPSPAVAVRHFIHDDQIRQGARRITRASQGHAFAAVGELALVIAHDRARAERGMVGS